MIHNIVFDLGNVLVDYEIKEYIEEQTKEKRAVTLLYEEIFRSVEWVQMDRGVLDEEEAIQAFQKRIPQEWRHYVPLLIHNWHAELTPDREIEELARRLKEEGYHLFLLSNTSKRFYQYREQIPALQFFDGEFISADYQMLKPEPLIYLTFYQQFGIRPSECFFIDDNNMNIEAAQRTGMQGFVYCGHIDKCKDAMRKEGIRI